MIQEKTGFKKFDGLKIQTSNNPPPGMQGLTLGVKKRLKTYFLEIFSNGIPRSHPERIAPPINPVPKGKKTKKCHFLVSNGT